MLEGEISQMNLIARLVELWREQFTGAIRFENDGIIKIIYFKSGDVLSASTNDRADSIDEILMRAGKVSREHVKQALARRKETETLGDAMLNLGYITRKELTWARRVQVVGVIRSIAAWTEGSFTVVADYLPKRDEGTLFPLPQLLVELIVTEQDRQKFDRALSGGDAVFQKTGEFDEVFRRLGLNEDAEAIVAQVDGTRNAAEVASASGRDTFNVYKLLHALATLGILEQLGKPQASPELSVADEFTAAGVADAADLWNDDQPAFEFDETEALSQPTLEVPGISFNDAPATAARSAWDEEPEEEPAPAAPAPMPAWNSTPPPPIAVPLPAPVEPPVDATEEWGFDEAQLETVRRASEPPPKVATPLPRKAKVKEGGRSGLLIALLLIAILAGGGYYGFLWWQKRQQDQPAATVEPVSVARTTTTAPPTTTAAPPPAPMQTATVVTATQPPTTATQPPPPAPLTVTPAAPTPEPAGALPVVRARPNGRARLDEMARNYAANPEGNFTVQIQILCDPANLEKLLRTGGASVWFVPQTIGERACYRVFWGRYGTRDEAQRALATLPASARDPNAAVKSVPGRR